MSSSERTAAEARASYIGLMGDALGAVYSELWQEVAWIHRNWGHYVELYGTGLGRIGLLNRCAPSFFRTVQDTLFEAVLLHLARLTDPPKSVGKSNLSLRHLAELVVHPELRTRVSELTAVAVDSTEFARDWRNRRLAHRDLDLALGLSAAPLAPASRLAVKEALASIVQVLNAVSLHYCDSTSIFDLSGGNDSVSMLYSIRDGLRAKDERLKRLRTGTYTEEDFKREGI